MYTMLQDLMPTFCSRYSVPSSGQVTIWRELLLKQIDVKEVEHLYNNQETYKNNLNKDEDFGVSNTWITVISKLKPKSKIPETAR